ncbi:hypothetical protein [Chitinophaga eiseniae]|uniref:Uncharacterized protein n=1 Tax=Chitinophaga eiseniae TaxID=634771 RepID=A0A847S5S2_9BACT|nr:hypothetical protein [Chitinophaga eiseniae]NLR77111.1 hypothetical protein [Chitinophaga eiseniae]
MQEITEYHDFIERIVKNDLDEIQQTIFKIDGEELIEQMFLTQNPRPVIEGKPQGLEYSAAPELIDTVVKSVVDLGGLLISTFTLYLQFKKYKDDEAKEKKKEMEQLWKDELIRNNVEEAAAERLARKYVADFERLLK